MKAKKKEQSKLMKVVTLVAYSVLICTGVVLFFNEPLVILFFSIAVAAFGVFQIAQYIVGKDEVRNFWDLIAGTVHILFAALVLFGDDDQKIFGFITLGVFIGIWILIAGALRIVGSIYIKNLGVKKWYLVLIGGILLIICSIICFIFPLISSITMIRIAGIFLGVTFIVMGTSGIIGTLNNKKVSE